MLSANELHRVTELNWPTPWSNWQTSSSPRRNVQVLITWLTSLASHEGCGLWDYMTHLCAQTNVLPRSQASAQLFVILGTRRLVNLNTCLESAYTRSPPCIYPSGWPYQNGGQYQRWIEKSWKYRGVNCFGLYQIHIHFFLFRLPCHCRVQQSFNIVNVLISKIFPAGWLTDWLTDWQTDKTDCLTPLCMRTQGNNVCVVHLSLYRKQQGGLGCLQQEVKLGYDDWERVTVKHPPQLGYLSWSWYTHPGCTQNHLLENFRKKSNTIFATHTASQKLELGGPSSCIVIPMFRTYVLSYMWTLWRQDLPKINSNEHKAWTWPTCTTV